MFVILRDRPKKTMPWGGEGGGGEERTKTQDVRMPVSPTENRES